MLDKEEILFGHVRQGLLQQGLDPQLLVHPGDECLTEGQPGFGEGRQAREQGGSVEDVMAVYDRLMQLRADIESLQGQLNRLEKLVAFSTISLHLEPSVLSKPIEGSGWHPLETARRSLDTLVDVLAGLGSFFIWFVIVVVPVLLILILPLVMVVWLLLRWRKRRHADRNSQE